MVAYEHYFYAFLPMMVLLAYWGSIRGTWCRRVFGNPWIVVTGGMCYTIYLVHSAIIVQFGRLGLRFLPAMPFGKAFVFWSVVLTPLALVISAVLFAVLERPCMNPAWPRLLAEKVRLRVARGRTRSA